MLPSVPSRSALQLFATAISPTHHSLVSTELRTHTAPLFMQSVKKVMEPQVPLGFPFGWRSIYRTVRYVRKHMPTLLFTFLEHTFPILGTITTAFATFKVTWQI